MINEINIYNDDCMQGIKNIDNKSIDLIVTDIPYGKVNRKSNGLRNLNKGQADIVNFDLEEMVREHCRILKGSIYIFCATEQASLIRETLIDEGLSTRLCIWEKTNPSPMNGEYIWLSGVECCIYGKFRGGVFNEHCKNTVFRYPCGRNKLHPTQKPLDLIKRFILASSNEGDLVFDGFMGSGTTGVACKELNRRFIGFEIDEEYFNIAKSRIDNISIE